MTNVINECKRVSPNGPSGKVRFATPDEPFYWMLGLIQLSFCQIFDFISADLGWVLVLLVPSKVTLVYVHPDAHNYVSRYITPAPRQASRKPSPRSRPSPTTASTTFSQRRAARRTARTP